MRHGVVVQASTGAAEVGGFCELEVSLVYKESLEHPGLHGETLSQDKTKQTRTNQQTP